MNGTAFDPHAAVKALREAGAEERGQAEAIARAIETCLDLRVPPVGVGGGEGGSGGAVALAAADRASMLENAVYSVISPEGCASILWRSAAEAREAAEALRLTAQDLEALGVVDKAIPDPVGGAHRDPQSVLAAVGDEIERARRRDKFMRMGRRGLAQGAVAGTKRADWTEARGAERIWARYRQERRGLSRRPGRTANIDPRTGGPVREPSEPPPHRSAFEAPAAEDRGPPGAVYGDTPVLATRAAYEKPERDRPPRRDRALMRRATLEKRWTSSGARERPRTVRSRYDSHFLST